MDIEKEATITPNEEGPSMEELRRQARIDEDNERIARQRSEKRNKIIGTVLGLGAVVGIAAYQVTKSPSEQVKDKTAIEVPEEQSPDLTANLKTNPEDTKFILDYLNKLPEGTPEDVIFGLRSTLEILMQDSEDSRERREAILAELNSTSPEEFLLIQHPYILLQDLYEGSPLFEALMASTNPHLKPLQDFMKTYPVTKGQEPKQQIRNLTLLLERLAENEASIPEDLSSLNFEDTIIEIRDGKVLPVSGASILYARPRPKTPAAKTSSYLESLRDSKINRQSKRDIFKLA